jgi:hypothetical protein
VYNCQGGPKLTSNSFYTYMVVGPLEFEPAELGYHMVLIDNPKTTIVC